MEARTGIAIALLLASCAQPQVKNEVAESLVLASPAVSRPNQRHKAPRRLRLRLTLDRPDDLQVKVNDQVVTEQVISHRSSNQASLIQKRESLRQQLKLLQAEAFTKIPPSYVVEQAEVAQARLKVEQTKAAIAHFHADSPWTEYARQMLPLLEHGRLGQLEAEYHEAKGNLVIAIAKLQKVQQQGAVEQETSAQQASLQNQLQNTEETLAALVVRSPYTGVVKKIRWLGQVNQALEVELTLVVSFSELS